MREFRRIFDRNVTLAVTEVRANEAVRERGFHHSTVAAGAYYSRFGRIDLARIHKAVLCTDTLRGGPRSLWKFYAPVLALRLAERMAENSGRERKGQKKGKDAAWGGGGGCNGPKFAARGRLKYRPRLPEISPAF